MVRVSVSETGRFDGPEDGNIWGLGPEVRITIYSNSGYVVAFYIMLYMYYTMSYCICIIMRAILYICHIR